MYEHNALGYWSGLAFCLTKVRSSQARCLATALISLLSLNIHSQLEEEVNNFRKITL